MRKVGTGFLCVLSLTLPALAGSITYTDSIPFQTTNWDLSVSIPKWDPALYPGQTLDQVIFSLGGAVKGSIKFESLDAAPATVTTQLKAQITLQRPDLTTLVVVLPVASNTDNVAEYDGITDYAGTSGKTYPSLSASDSETSTSPPPASDLLLFSGSGNITLPVKAEGQSSGSGAGNLLVQFSSEANADVSVTYVWSPEPASLGLLALGALTVLRRR